METGEDITETYKHSSIDNTGMKIVTSPPISPGRLLLAMDSKSPQQEKDGLGTKVKVVNCQHIDNNL